MSVYEKYWVVFPKKGTLKALLASLESLGNQIYFHSIKKDLESTIEKIVLADDKLTIQVSSKKLDFNYTLNSFVKKEIGHIKCQIPIPLSLSDFAMLLQQLITLSYNEMITHKGQVYFHSIELINSELIIKLGSESIRNIRAENNTKTLMLIDGSNVLSMAYYATAKIPGRKSMQTVDGKPTNAVYSMIKKVLSLCKTYRPSHMAICWDVSRNTFRRELYAPYKAHRGDIEPELREQFETAKELFIKANIPQFELEGYEADDLIGSFVQAWSKNNDKVYIVSSDKDLFQLLDGNVYQILQKRGKQEIINVDQFRNEYGIEPSQWVDIKAIIGDPSDNIPGCKGVGEKAAYPLLQRYQSLEELYQKLDELNDTEFQRYINKLQAAKDEAFLSKKLATLVIDLFTDFDICNLELKIDKQGLLDGFRQLEFNSLINDIRAGKYRAS